MPKLHDFVEDLLQYVRAIGWPVSYEQCTAAIESYC